MRPSGLAGGLALKCVAWSAGLALVAARVGPAQAVDGIWQGAGAEWTTGSNWSSAPLVPDGIAAFTNNGAPTTVTISNSTSIDTMEFTAAAPAYSFTVTNGANFTINSLVANSSAFQPNFAVNAGATLTVGDNADIFIGSLSNGTGGGGTIVIGPTDPSTYLSLTPATSTTFSGSFSGAGSLELANSSATLTLTGASNGGNIGTIGGDLTLCNCYGGGLTIDGGTLTVNGLGQGIFIEGGTLSVINGGTLQDNLDLLVASAMVVSGAGSSVTVAGFTGVGVFDSGTLIISNGGTLNSQGGAEIDAFFGTPSVTVTGAGSTWNVGGLGLAVGSGSTGGPGTLTVANGGQVNAAGIIGVGDQGPGTSFMTVTGAGSTVTTNLLLIGETSVAIGTVNIAAGGVVNASIGTGIGAGSTLNLGTGGLSGAIVTPTIVNDGAIVANFTDALTLGADISGAGTLSKAGAGVLTLTGNSSFTGGTTVNGGTLLVNGSLASGVTVNGGGTLGGTGTVGTVVNNGGAIAPGNSIGTLTVAGNFTQNGGRYRVEVNSAGQGDRINVSGIATLNGGTVQVQAQSGYAHNTTYTILSATGGVNGAYSGVFDNFAFMAPSLSYDANNVFLTLSLSFIAGAQTPNQYAVATALDRSSTAAAGDFASVLDALSVLTVQEGPAALNAISGQQYADFGTMNVQGAVLFMNVVGQQMALARGGTGAGQRQALAQACDIQACDGTSPWSAWASGLAGLGSVAGNGNSSTMTYNFGGAAAGIDYRLDARTLVGLSVGYAAGNQWVDSFLGRGWTDTVSVAAYGSFTQAGFYADALAGYAWSGNQMQRQIVIPGLQPRTANGSTGANQFLGQVEAGYRIGVFAPAAASVTPFARLQGSTVTQNAFSEWGANSLSLNVAAQTTSSLRTVFGADLAGAIGLGGERTLGLDLRLGWLHEYANTGRPITAAFAGAPSNAFAVYGATPQRDAAVIGFTADTTLAEATRLFVRYDGEIAGGSSNHTFNLGVRFSW